MHLWRCCWPAPSVADAWKRTPGFGMCSVQPWSHACPRQSPRRSLCHRQPQAPLQPFLLVMHASFLISSSFNPLSLIPDIWLTAVMLNKLAHEEAKFQRRVRVSIPSDQSLFEAMARSSMAASRSFWRPTASFALMSWSRPITFTFRPKMSTSTADSRT